MDTALFHAINSGLSHPWLDATMPALTSLNRYPAFWVVITCALGYWIYRRRAEALRLSLSLGAAVAAADLLCYRVIKPLVQRLRPEYVETVILREGAHSRFGFPSNHAANAFAVAGFLSAVYPRASIAALLIAALIAFSRVYVGAHYPGDVVGGAIIGFAIGRGFAWLSRTCDYP